MPVVRRLARRLLCGWAAVAIGVGSLTLVPEAADAQSGPSSFSGSSDGFGVNVTITIPGAPITNTPVDSGGPTAQAMLTSFGTSQAYAAFPDPGQFVISLPGLIEGLLGTGLSGLPPIKNPPPLPTYPFFVQSTGGTTPSARLGAGPYLLRATSTDSASDATATAGLRDAAIGNAVLVTSTAGVTVQSDGSVMAQATSDIQGLTVGPLSFGEIQSTATETAGADGSVTPSTNLVITGVRIGGLAVSLSSTGLNVLGENVPLPIGPVLQAVLARAGLTLTVLAPQTFKGEILAPAIELTGPVNDLGLGTGEGTFSLTLGGAEAAMQVGAAPPAIPLVSSPSALAPASGGPTGPTNASTGAAAPQPVSAGPGGSGGPDLGGVPAGSATTAAPISVPASSAPSSARRSLAYVSDPIGFDIRSVYLVFAAAAVMAVLAAQLLRTLGVRGPWTSSSG